MSNGLLAIKDLHVQYGRVAALRGISLHVDSREIVGVIGPNGAGKSTTLLTICGVARPSAGEILLEGRSIVGAVPERIVRQGVSLVPEARRIFARLTVEENLRLGATPRRKSAVVDEEVAKLFERFPGLARYRRSRAGSLSGGEQQQLAIGRALLSRPKLLLLDEPSLGLAPLVIERVWETLQEIRAEGVTLLLVEQNAARALEISDRLYVMQKGSVMLHGTPDEMQRNRDFESIYLAGVLPEAGDA